MIARCISKENIVFTLIINGDTGSINCRITESRVHIFECIITVIGFLILVTLKDFTMSCNSVFFLFKWPLFSYIFKTSWRTVCIFRMTKGQSYPSAWLSSITWRRFEDAEVLFPYIRHLGTKLQWVVSFIFRPLYLHKQSSMPIEVMLCGSRSRFEIDGL